MEPLLRGEARRERRAKLALALLVVAAPLAYGARLLFAAPTPRPATPNPAQVHLVVLTVGRWATPARLPDHPAFAELARRGVTADPLFATTDDPFGAAASLWTGRFAPHHGVRGPELGLREGDWTLARAARDSGARTAAVLELPFVATTRVGGFDEVVEDPSIDTERAVALVETFLAREPGRRKLLWVHLRDPGEGGERAGAVLDAALRTLDATGQRPDAFVLFTALSGAQRAEAELALRVPLVAQLPASLNAGRVASAHLSHADLAGGLAELLLLAGPDVAAGEARLQSRGEALTATLQAQPVFEWVWCEGEFGAALRRRGLRVLERPAEPGGAPTYEAGILAAPLQAGSALDPFAPADVPRAIERFEGVRRGVLSGATAPEPTRLPPGWE